MSDHLSQILTKLDELHLNVRSISERMSLVIGSQNSMSLTLADVDAALAQEDASLATLGNALATVSADITTLISKVEDGASVDLPAELAGSAIAPHDDAERSELARRRRCGRKFAVCHGVRRRLVLDKLGIGSGRRRIDVWSRRNVGRKLGDGYRFVRYDRLVTRIDDDMWGLPPRRPAMPPQAKMF